MTEAVCFNCGDLKRGAFSNCENCGAHPQSDDDLMLSLAITDHYFDHAGLEQIGRDIAAGRFPQLDQTTKEKLRPAVLEAKRILGIGRDKKRETAATGGRMSIFSRLFGKKTFRAKPFHANATREAAANGSRQLRLGARLDQKSLTQFSTVSPTRYYLRRSSDDL